jgi:peptide/nickel transport system permease protein
MKKQVLKLLLKRLLASLIVLFFMISLLFFLLRISPGDPSQKFISPELSVELASKVRESFHLNSPLLEQYSVFLSNLIKGDFGISYTYRISVSRVIAEYLPFTIFFSFTSFIVQICTAFFLAITAVKKKHGLLDNFASKLSLIFFSIPSFVLGVILIFFFSEILEFFPSSGLKSYENESLPFFLKLADYMKHLTLPFITLSVGGIAVFFKYLRDNLNEIFNKSFVLNLRANGFDESVITLHHIIPNALAPLVSIAGVELGLLLSGTLITEVVFGLPGMGRLTINAILTRDYPLILGCTFIAGVMVLLSNLAADLVKMKIDKRLLKGI